MEITIKADKKGIKNIRSWMAYEMNGHFSYPNNALGVQVVSIEFLPDWMKKHILDTGYKYAGAYRFAEGQFYLGAHGEWVSVDDHGVIKMAGQFHELQYYISILRNHGLITGWEYHGHHDLHVGLAPWEPPTPRHNVADKMELAKTGRLYRPGYTCVA